MIKGNNCESIRRLLVFILVFSGVMACTLSPCRVFASGTLMYGLVFSIIILVLTFLFGRFFADGYAQRRKRRCN